MMRDYSERRQDRKKEPKKSPAVWPYVVLILLIVILAFAAGVGSGWYLFRPGGRLAKAPVAAPVAAQKNPVNQPLPNEPLQTDPSATTLNQPVKPSTPLQEKGSAAPPLTFYNNLQKGGSKELMGTGINNVKEGEKTLPKPASPP